MDPTFISYFHPRTLTVFILFLANSTLQLSVISCNLFLASLVQKFVFDSNIQSPSKIVLGIRQQNFLLKNFKNIHSYHFSTFLVHSAVRCAMSSTYLVNALNILKLRAFSWLWSQKIDGVWFLIANKLEMLPYFDYYFRTIETDVCLNPYCKLKLT